MKGLIFEKLNRHTIIIKYNVAIFFIKFEIKATGAVYFSWINYDENFYLLTFNCSNFKPFPIFKLYLIIILFIINIILVLNSCRVKNE